MVIGYAHPPCLRARARVRACVRACVRAFRSWRGRPSGKTWHVYQNSLTRPWCARAARVWYRIQNRLRMYLGLQNGALRVCVCVCVCVCLSVCLSVCLCVCVCVFRHYEMCYHAVVYSRLNPIPPRTHTLNPCHAMYPQGIQGLGKLGGC